MTAAFIIRCEACGKRIRYLPGDSEARCPRCGVVTTRVQTLDGARGPATYNGELEDALRWTLALPD